MISLLRTTFYKFVHYLIQVRDSKVRSNTNFPTNRGRNYLYEPLFSEDGSDGFYTKFYAEDVENPATVDFKRFKMELLSGQLYPAGRWHDISCAVPSVIPYAITNADKLDIRKNHSVELRAGGEPFEFNNLVSERFYYLPLHELTEIPSVSFRCAHDLIIGDPLPLVQRSPHKHRLVLVLFLDNLGWEITKRYPLEDLMPNLARFFSKGMIFNNYFVNSNWTLPSVSSMVSGKSLSTHMMFHPQDDLVVGNGYPIMSELFQRHGYMTFQACGNWRKSPRYGYAKGYDRTIYRNQMSLSDIFDSFLSNMRAFPKRDHFAWLSVFDLHHPMGLVPEIEVQVGTPLEGHDYSVDHEKSPMQLKQNFGRTMRYVEEMKRVDFRLGPILSWLEETFDDDEMVVAAISDHGTTFMTEDTHPLSQERCNGAFMLRGGGVPAGQTDEIVQTEDLLPTLMQLSGLALDDEIDGRVPEVLGGPPAREFAYSEIMYPNDYYRAAVRDKEYVFYLETAQPVEEDGRISLAGSTSSLYRKEDPDNELGDADPARCEQFQQIVHHHISAKR